MAKLAMILTPGFADWEYALLAGTGRAYYGAEIAFFAPAKGPVTSLGGLTAQVDRDLAELKHWPADAVICVGGTIWETSEAPALDELLQHHRNRGAIIGGICGGTLPLARAGLLNDIAHTSNTAAFLQNNVASYGGAARYRDVPQAVSDQGVVSAAGTAPASFAAEVLAAVGVETEAVSQLRGVLAAEHQAS